MERHIASQVFTIGCVCNSILKFCKCLDPLLHTLKRAKGAGAWQLYRVLLQPREVLEGRAPLSKPSLLAIFQR